jgi:8-oxo-dGTP pyrophosphatase MutT (NUDIX family)
MYYLLINIMIKNAVMLLFTESDQVMLVKSTQDNKWMSPGGHIDGDETPLDAMIREFKEETGFDLPKTQTLKSYDYNKHTRIYYGVASHQFPKFEITKTKKPYEVSEIKYVLYKDIFDYDLKTYVRNSLIDMMKNKKIKILPKHQKEIDRIKYLKYKKKYLALREKISN